MTDSDNKSKGARLFKVAVGVVLAGSMAFGLAKAYQWRYASKEPRLSKYFDLGNLILPSKDSATTDSVASSVSTFRTSDKFLALFAGSPDTMPSYLRPLRDNDEFKEAYPKEIPPPVMDTTLDLSQYNLEQIRYLKSFVAARHGFLFRDMVLRGFFNRFDWYQPIWTTENFQPRLSAWEVRWQAKLAAREKELRKGMYSEVDGVRRASADHLVNLMMFDSLSDRLLSHLDTAGFAVVPGEHRQLWNVYDKNQYDGVPSFVTTDAYIQLLHMHFKYLMKRVERERLVGALGSGLQDLRSKLGGQAPPSLKDGTDRATAIVALAQAFLTNSVQPMSNLSLPMRRIATQDFAAGKAGNGVGSKVLEDSLFDWTQLVPRGHYDGSDTMRGYFRAVKWLGTAHLKLTPTRAGTTLALARAWKSCGPNGPEGIRKIGALADAFSGSQNGASLQDLVQVAGGQDLSSLVGNTASMKGLADGLEKLRPARMRAKGANTVAAADLAESFVRIFPLRWSGDGEILQRLIHVQRPEPKRPFPSGLDVFAVRGIEEAHTILVDELKVVEKWPEWADTFAVLKKTPELVSGTDFHSRRMGLLQTLFQIPAQAPPFQQTKLWMRHILVTGLAGWTLQKQENILYQEQANAAECGEGGGPPPPDPKGWVDPNPAFWDGAAQIVRSVDSLLGTLNVKTESVKSIDAELLKDFAWLADASRRELAGKDPTAQEMESILWIGGRLETLTAQMTEMDMAVFDQSDEGMAAAVTDVYSWNSDILLEGTTTADELWAMVPIGGDLHLVRGAVFSHREWIGDKRLTDREWHKTLEDKKGPARASWQDPLFVDAKSPVTVPSSSGLMGSGECR